MGGRGQMAWKFPGRAWPFPHTDLGAAGDWARDTDPGDATQASSCVLLHQELGVCAGGAGRQHPP